MSDGSKTDYYNIQTDGKEYIDVDHIANKMDMTFFEGTILKSLIGINIARRTNKARHDGTDIKRDINKIKHYLHLIEDELVEKKKKRLKRK